MSHSDLIDPLDLSEVEAHLRTAFHATADDLRVSRSPVSYTHLTLPTSDLV